MTRATAKLLSPIIKAYGEGKIIQYLSDNNIWEDREYLYFEEEPYRYRIKPKTKYRPFKNIEECLNEMSKHQPFGWYKYNNNDYNLVTHLDNNTDFEYRFKNYIFADGTPFGIKEEE